MRQYRCRMDRRRLAGLGVLAAAVVALAVGTGLARPPIGGAAQASPVDSPPQVGDCLYAGPDGPWVMTSDGSALEDRAHARWYAACGDPWFGEVVAVRTPADIQADLTTNRSGVGFDPCAAATSAYLGRPVIAGVAGWQPVAIFAVQLEPDLRQRAAGQRWQACVLGPLAFGPGGEPRPWASAQGGLPISTELLRGRWNEPDLRNRVGQCESGPPGAATPVFCGSAHDREVVAWGSWERSVDAATLQQGCAVQAAAMMQRSEPTVAGTLAVDVTVPSIDGASAEVLASDAEFDSVGSARCVIRAANPARQLTATVIGLGDGPVPLTSE